MMYSARITMMIALSAALAAPLAAQQRVPRESTPPSSGGGSIRYSDRNRDSKPPADAPRRMEREPRDGEREMQRGDRDRHPQRETYDENWSRSLQRGSSVTRLPDRNEKVELNGRSYRRYDDRYFVEHESERGLQYVVVDPPRGATLTRIPQRHERVTYGGSEFYCSDDVYYRPEPHAGRTRYVVVDPPVGATIRRLPDHHQFVVIGGERLCRVDDLFFRPIHLGGVLVYIRIERPPPVDACVSGAVAYRERIMLPRDAVVIVELLELTRFGTVRRSVGKQVIARPRIFPVPFEICVDPREIDPRREYAIDAQIVAGGRPRYICQERTRVLTSGRPNRVEVFLRIGG